ncbi:fascin-3 [Alligator mississippiensis]|uniref:Fascin n=1 Tax=Alligator mississippiensis TaxID=8496 RepID=A0A151NK15_ALLMI|nr:fascin-3 [Alligator mississippiensis]KYO37122.1 fascin-3 [Alligator mississippiensis]
MRVGLIDWAGSYLSNECFRDGVTALGKTLGRKQTWELRVSQKRGKQAVVELLGHQGHHLLVDPDGGVRCGHPATPGQSQFLLQLHGDGAWTLQQLDGGKFLESDGENVLCVSRQPRAPRHLWLPQPAIHAHVALYHPASRCYARADPHVDQVWVDQPVPYGQECGFVLRFRGSLCHVETAAHTYVSRAEKLAPQPSADTAFRLSLAPGGLASLSHPDGRVLCPQGGRRLLTLVDQPSEEDRWFVLKRCPTWVSLRTQARRYVSIICDTEVYAGTDEVTPKSVFLYEYDRDTKTVQFKAINNSYLAQRKSKSIVANGLRMEPETNFRITWHHGQVVLQAFNGRYLGTLPVGLVVASAAQPGPNEVFGVRLSNRPFLVLHGRYGYVGSSACHEALQCNLADPDCIELLPCVQGIYHFQAHGRGFWSLSSDGTFRTGGKFALNFYLEIRGNNVLAVLAPNGYYLRGDRSGMLRADGEEVTSECLWEF